MPDLTSAGAALLPVYATMPLRAVSGRGSWLIDEQGQEWLDAYGGHAVAATGHCHPDVVRAIAEQAGQLLFYSTAVPHHAREQLAD
ncbi:MAG: aminotransferase class III-fold pyridoxal phosphate-dependent enzyme, partial [Gemmatimonadales bacterium]